MSDAKKRVTKLLEPPTLAPLKHVRVVVWICFVVRHVIGHVKWTYNGTSCSGRIRCRLLQVICTGRWNPLPSDQTESAAWKEPGLDRKHETYIVATDVGLHAKTDQE